MNTVNLQKENEAMQGCVVLLLLPLLFVIGGFSVMIAWNYGMVKAFELPIINFWQAAILDCFVTYLVPYTSIKETGYTPFEKLFMNILNTVFFVGIILFSAMFV